VGRVNVTQAMNPSLSPQLVLFSCQRLVSSYGLVDGNVIIILWIEDNNNANFNVFI
jgi:hypothetical protein